MWTLRRLLSVFALGTLWSGAALGCKPKIPEPQPLQSAAAPSERVAQKPSPPTSPAKPKPGWSEVVVQNSLPLCVFANASERTNAASVAQVKKQTLKADQPLAFGVFAPHCIHPQCEELARLQCSVERSGNTLRLHTEYVGFRKDGAACTDACRELSAGCESPVLEPGEYQVEYGGTQVPLKIPSSLNMPCFKRS